LDASNATPCRVAVGTVVPGAAAWAGDDLTMVGPLACCRDRPPNKGSFPAM
jgi:hypothetical protein